MDDVTAEARRTLSTRREEESRRRLRVLCDSAVNPARRGCISMNWTSIHRW